MKRSAFALLAGVLLLGLLPGSVLAKASNVDQSNTTPYAELFSNSGYPIAQTFTAGKTGMLSAIDMFLDCVDGNPASVAIYATGPATHLPTGAPLVSVPFDPAGAALDVARQNYLVTLGIAPLSPSMAYGYIQQGEPLKGEFKYPVYKVKGFKEKPDEKMAQGFLRSGGYSWNSGIFVWRVSVILSEIEKQMPMLSSALLEISSAWETPKQTEVLRAHWRGLKPETVDYGIMERAENVAVLPASGLGWSDVGSWDTLFDVLFPDMAGNVSVNAQHLALETNNTLVYGTNSERLIVTIGLDDTVVVDSGDVLLICKSDQAQRVRDVVEHLKKHRQEKYL